MANASFDLQYSISEAEFCRAHRVHLRRTLITLKNFVLVTFALGLGALQAQIFGRIDWTLAVFLVLWLLVLGSMLYAFWVLPPRLYRHRHGSSSEVELHADSTGLRIRTAEGQRTWGWKEYSHWSDQATALLIHPVSGAPIPIPVKAFAGTEQIRSFVEFLDSHRPS